MTLQLLVFVGLLNLGHSVAVSERVATLQGSRVTPVEFTLPLPVRSGTEEELATAELILRGPVLRIPTDEELRTIHVTLPLPMRIPTDEELRTIHVTLPLPVRIPTDEELQLKVLIVGPAQGIPSGEELQPKVLIVGPAQSTQR